MSEPNQAHRDQRDVWVSVGLSVSAVAALVSSFSGLRSLALAAGWAPLLAFLLPVTVDAYAMTATRVWLAGSTRSQRARRFARSNAIGAILLSLAGNATDHLIAAGLLRVTWLIVLCVGAVPPVILGLVSHLAVLRQQSDQRVPVPARVPVAVPNAEPRPVSATSRRTRRRRSGRTGYGSDEELRAAARRIDAAWQAAHGGRSISRDNLRLQLRISAARATDVLKQIRTEENAQPTEHQEAHAE